jgi:hypothetical protein
VLNRDYFVSQVTSLLKFAKETTNPLLAAVLIEKAADLKFQVDESSTTPDPDSSNVGCPTRKVVAGPTSVGALMFINAPCD